MNEKQRDALEILRNRYESGKPSQWVWPASVSRSPQTFRVLWQKGYAERRINRYSAYEYRWIPASEN